MGTAQLKVAVDNKAKTTKNKSTTKLTTVGGGKKAAAATAKKTAGKPETITLLAKKCPSKAGTKRAKRWALLKTGMPLAEALKAGIPPSYLKKMTKAGHLRVGG